jgi:hypothetical protein
MRNPPTARTLLLFLCAALVATHASARAGDGAVDLSRAVVVTPPGLSGPENKAVLLLLDEVEKRTQIRWQRSERWPAEAVPVVAVGQATALRAFSNHLKIPAGNTASQQLPAEGYRVQTISAAPAPVVQVAGNDARGVLFGVGRLLRALLMRKNSVLLPAGFEAVSAPRYPLRGHQLGYRPKTNSYDGWDLPQWEQYIRDLAVFGTNAIELIPPRSDDAADSPHFPRPQLEMMVGMSRLCAEYGLDVWIWFPALDKDYSDPKTVERALAEWGHVFAHLPRIDAVFVPGGDPGHTQPRHLMALLEKQSEVLHKHHPAASMWVSPQGFDPEWMREFLDILRTEPSWLGGVAYGPGTRMTLPQLRSVVPKRYPIRHYPDITHSRTSQYPVPDWDTAFAMTEGREVINPRPRGEARIFRVLQPQTCGFITYSEGCNDDVNKVVWSALGWDPDGDVVGILRDYSRYFIGPDSADGFAQGLLALERNWEGPVLSNAAIRTTLLQFQDMERAASPGQLLNWRFQQALYRAYYDAYVRVRLLYETQLEDEATAELRRANRIGSLKAMDEAEKVLERAVRRPVSEDLRARVFELGEALYQSIRMQLSVDRYKAISIGRGATLDTIDRPLNDRAWLLDRFAGIRKLPSEVERLKRIDEIVNWTNPGPGGYYDDAGNPARQPHLVRNADADQDPAFFKTVATVFEDKLNLRKSWWDQSMAHYDLPLIFRYTDLDPNARYVVRVVYGSGPLRLVTNDGVEIHSYLKQPYELLEFPIPRQATSGGRLELRWQGQTGRGGNGRGCQLCELWLLKR